MAEPQENFITHGTHAVHDVTTPEVKSSLRKKSRLDSPEDETADQRPNGQVPALVKDIGRLATRLYYGNSSTEPAAQANVQDAGGDSSLHDEEPVQAFHSLNEGEAVQTFHSVRSQSSDHIQPNGTRGTPAQANTQGDAGGDSRHAPHDEHKGKSSSSSQNEGRYGPILRGRDKEDKTAQNEMERMREDLDKAKLETVIREEEFQKTLKQYNDSLMEHKQT